MPVDRSEPTRRLAISIHELRTERNLRRKDGKRFSDRSGVLDMCEVQDCCLFYSTLQLRQN